MSALLVFIQHDNGGLAKGSLAALTAARELATVWGHTAVSAIVLGSGARAAAEAIAGFGVAAVRFSEDGLFTRYRAEPYARAVVAASVELGCTTVVGAASSTGKDLLPRVAALLDAGQASDVVAVNADGSLRRPMYAGNIIADVEVVSPNKVVSVRGTAFAPAVAGSTASGVVAELSLGLDPELREQPRFGEVLGYEESKADRPQLSDAEVVVSGGRALGSAEKFEQVVFPLADALGAAVGASRAAVDSGYAPNDWQVGQTGKVVAPKLYIALGISGAIQHLAGMKDSKVIVAINKDPEAPIFEVADYGIVGDLFQIAPELTAAVKKISG